MKIREDINFLNNPNWVVSKRKDLKKITIESEAGLYEMSTTSALGLPLRLDKIILYYLKCKLLSSDGGGAQVDTTRYEIATNVFMDSDRFSQTRYERIIESVEKWQSVRLSFSGSFYEKDEYVDKQFSIIDTFEVNTKKRLLITFNELYVAQLRETQFYKILSFGECKKLATPVSLRLYEIVLRQLTQNVVFYIDIKHLAEKLTIQKKSYESQILVAVTSAVEQINLHTNLNIQFHYEKKLSLCVFRAGVEIVPSVGSKLFN